MASQQPLNVSSVPLSTTTSASSGQSATSKTPLNPNKSVMSTPIQQNTIPKDISTTAESSTDKDTTYFLLDMEDLEKEEPMDIDRTSRRSSKSSTHSSSSSVSAQVVIDHGESLPRRIEKSRAARLMRTGDDESESDYTYSYVSVRRDAEEEASSGRHLHNHNIHMYLKNAIHTPQDDIQADESGRSAGESAYGSDKEGIHYLAQSPRHRHRHKRNRDTKTDAQKRRDRKGKGVTVYTDDQEDLMDEMPSWDQERMRQQSGTLYPSDDENINSPARYRGRSSRRKPKKKVQGLLKTDLQTHSWSRRESLQSNRDPGLSSEDALRKLLYIANQIIDEKRATLLDTTDIWSWVIRPEMILSILGVIMLLAFYIFGYSLGNPYQYRVTGALVEAFLVLCMSIWNWYICRREQRLTECEMIDRADTIISALKQSGMNMVQDTKIPFIPSMSVAKVVRDGVVRTFPVNLLVKGDVVEMLYGDVAPGRMKYIHKPAHVKEEAPVSDNGQSVHEETTIPEMKTREYYLAQDQAFKPSFFGIPPPAGLMEEYLHARGRHQFILLETPLEKNMRAALSQQRPQTVIANEAQVIMRVFYRYILWIAFGGAICINLLRFGLRERLIEGYSFDELGELLLSLPFYTILPLLPLCLPSLWIVTRSLGNAQLLILFEALQISKTEYEDDDEVDEFDTEAPPPTKDVELSPNAVWDRFCSLLTKWDQLSLTRSTNLLESLGSTTVICCLDREGTISNPFPTVEQIMFPNSEEDVSYLDLEEDSDGPCGIKFEDQDWEQNLPCLKPLGLNFMLNTNCGIIQGKKRSDYHRRRSKLHVYGKTSPARQSCLCRLGKCIGFREEALQSFALRAEIYTFAPYHSILSTPRYQYSQYFSFEVPNALSTVFEETTTESYQLLTDGHPALVLEKCSDYWDGIALQTMSETMEKKISDFFQNAMVHDMQCIAYAYRPINTANGQRISFLNPSNDKDPGCAFIVIPYKSPSSDSSDTSSESSSEDTIPSKPIHSNLSIEPAGTTDGNEYPFQTDSFNSGLKHDYSPPKKSNGSDSVSISSDNSSHYSFEDDEPVNEQEEGTFYKEVVKGQIFLGIAAMCHQPKQNVVDFIEDLGLAGIRFVYFSPTAERESKAFAERLGLETDWNSCILLSSPDDEHCGNGYLQTHDIKAQLPRGIDQIKPHLENVDDIPLHVSLFAECTPRAMKEMISIFQEYGEVVCCIGNALNVKNTESFALADVSIAMEPMHTRAQIKGRLSLNSRQPPLAVGASLVSLPCGLFMQYDTSLYAVTQLIRDARRLLSCVRMGFAFYVGACMSLSIIQLLSFCMLLPPILTGYQIIWIMWITLPILTMSMLFSPKEDNIMLLMPGKNIEHLTDLGRFMVYFILRFVPLVIMCIAVFSLTLAYSLKTNVSDIFGHFGESGWLHWTAEEQWAVLYAQNFMLLVLVWYFAWMSPSFLHRTSSLIEFIPFRNRIWISAFFLSIVLQIIFCAISLAHGPFELSRIPWLVYFIGLAFPLVLVPVQELVKMHDNKEFTRFQKRSKLEFSTKLGMHSPL
ncbi:hypothetical protein BDF14DRAFT_1851990 [Spinellus fusiger]|nr:hypothetical protein BDF14DRAFT_1851990 [Spinellus fusiger]